MNKTKEMMEGTHKRHAQADMHESEYECPGCGMYFNGFGTLSHHTDRCQKALLLDGDDAGELNDDQA